MQYSRNSFLKALGLGGLLATGSVLTASPFRDILGITNIGTEARGLTLGLASYSTRKFSLDETLAMANRLNLKQIALKSMHMPLESSEEDIKNITAKFEKAGIGLYGGGVIYMKTAQEVENAFRYAKAAKMKVIIGVPNHDLLPLVEMKVKETNIKLAIHNHGPGDKVYPTPEVVYDKIKMLDPRIGLCIDVGHVQRLGLDPVKNIEMYADRLYDIHLKDVDKSEADGKSVEFGRGVLDIPAVLNALKAINYTGVMAMEFEKDSEDVFAGLAECVGYVNGVLDAIK
ncbi:sugar phosphate isomerase/epimerase [Arenibacter sp. ARW7G5Y1]|uniref:sugar phosphate isomerase/epimerase family protein n=1 Tax=Arenibacter sp. ARW7G5Y1 TaxID=2135619 RepID=UPI000D76737A|nr:sugar phosphate isomerase/epimerase [Arenibacter sp. ARW7G5Y1]PXX28438.1 sugar phosphate isomerase/epimerase [Arenibacter sp. ARW7G5Y1]